MSSALRLRWLWLQKTELEKAWAFFPVQTQPQVKEFFAIAIVTEVRNGKNTLFWTARWLLGQSFEQTLPHLFSSVAARANKKTVHAAL
jgi:hypothetical protein